MMELDRGPMAPTNEKLDAVLYELYSLNLALRELSLREPVVQPAPIIQVSGPDVDLSELQEALSASQRPVDLSPLLDALSALSVGSDGVMDAAILDSLAGLRKEFADLGVGMRAIAGSSSMGGGGQVFLPPDATIKLDPSQVIPTTATFDPTSVLTVIPRNLSPDLVYEDQRGAGTRTITPATATLGASGVYTSDWIDCEQFPTARLLVTADVPSADNGLILQWSDTSGGTVRTYSQDTFNAGATALGRLYSVQTRARYLRVTYTNGLAPQGRFFLNLRMSPIPVASTVEIAASTRGDTGQQDVTLVASQIAGTPLAGRKSFRLKNLSTSARPLFYGFNSGITTATGDELAAGESVEMDLDESVTVYVMTTSTGGGGVRAAYAEIA